MQLDVAISATPPASPRCRRCVYLNDCGGLDSLFNCFDVHCCGTGNCDEICPKHPKYFERLAEVGGIHFDDLKPAIQADGRLPVYVPHLPHQYIRHEHLDTGWVSISPYQL